MAVFSRVASTRSFSGAARELGISQATASKHVQMLEGWLGVRLLHRTTRRVALTEAGQSFFLQCSRILEEMEAARSAAKHEAPVRGNMRIAAPVGFGSARLGPLVVGFMQRNPELSLHIELSDRQVDIIEEGYDLAIRTGLAAGPGLTTWRLMPLDYVLCAAPAYLARHGVPRTPTELRGHHCIAGTDLPGSWQFHGPEGETEVPIYGRLQVNNAMLRRDAARAGAGILLCADYLVEEDFANGRLVRLLPEHKPAGNALHAASPEYRAATPKVRSLVNHLTAQLGAAD
jgi:DNA-binding transcriptional LysR family regulator